MNSQCLKKYLNIVLQVKVNIRVEVDTENMYFHSHLVLERVFCSGSSMYGVQENKPLVHLIPGYVFVIFVLIYF